MAERKNVLVVDPRADWYVDELGSRFPELELVGARTFDEVEDALGETEILLTIGTVVIGAPFTPEVAARMPALKWVQCLISGYEHVERALNGREEVTVTTTTGIHGPQVSELAILFMLGLGRDLRTLMRCQDAHVWERPLPRILESKVVGIVGLGTIGSHLAPICKVFGMTVYGFTRTARSVAGVDRMFRRDELPAAAPELDYLVLLVPGGEETRHLVDASLLGLMKSSAFLINLSRGSVVDEEALIAALEARTIAGAGLDVFEVEPLPADSPLWGLDNVILTAHIGGPNDRYAEQTLAVVEPNLRAWLAGDRGALRNVVQKGVR